MILFTNLSSSIYGPHFYSTLLKQKMSFSFKYFFGFIAALALLVSIIVLFFAGTSLTSSNLDPHLAKYEALFPDNLAITVKNGEASANVQMPYFIDAPADSIFDNKKTDAPQYLFAIDTTEVATVGLYQKYNAFILLTKDALVTPGNNGQRDSQLRITSLRTFPDGKLDKPFVSTVFLKLKSFLPFLLPLFFFFVFGFVFTFMAIELVYLFVGALLIWLVLSIMKIKAGYWKSYQIGLHAITLPLILSIALFRLPQFQFPYMFTIVMLLVVIGNVYVGRRRGHHS